MEIYKYQATLFFIQWSHFSNLINHTRIFPLTLEYSLCTHQYSTEISGRRGLRKEHKVVEDQSKSRTKHYLWSHRRTTASRFPVSIPPLLFLKLFNKSTLFLEFANRLNQFDFRGLVRREFGFAFEALVPVWAFWSRSEED